MKKLTFLAASLVLTALLLTGCRNNNQPMETTRPEPMPTTQATIAPTTEATMPSTAATLPTETNDMGNGPMNGTDGNNSTEVTGDTNGNTGMNGDTGNVGSAVEGRNMPSMPRNR